ncbi:MAG: hypothetical protein DRQ24_11755, partial [Candidatus Latescibacterota bacterium]
QADQYNTKYYWKVSVNDSIDNTTKTYFFITKVNLPDVTTNESTGVEETNATLHGYLQDDGGEPCGVWFEYGVDTSYGNTTYRYDIIEDTASGVTDASVWIIGTFQGKTFNTSIQFEPNHSFTISTIAMYIDNITGSGYDADVDIYISSGGADTNWGEGTKVKDSWNPSWSAGWQMIYLDTKYDVTSGNTYEIEFITRNDTTSNNYLDLAYDGNMTYPIAIKVMYGTGGSNIYGYGALRFFDTTSTGNEFSYNLSGLSYGTFYHYRAVANNSNSTVYGSDKTFLTKPLPPTSFSAITYSNTQINLTWTKGTGANYTYIERNATGQTTWNRGEGILVYNDTGSQYEDTGLAPHTTYYYQAWSYTTWGDLQQWSDNSVSANNITKNSVPSISNPSPGNNSVDVDITQSSVSVTITDIDGDTFNWTIETSPDVGNASGNNENNGTKICTLSTPLNYNATYTWYVNVTDGYDWTNKSFSFTTRSKIKPNHPSNITVTSVSSTSIYLNWVKGVNSTHTYIERNTTTSWSRGNGTLVYNGTGSSFIDTGLSISTNYTYRFWGYNSTENSFSTNNTSGYNWTLPQPPQNVTIHVNDSNLSFNWTKGGGADATLIVQKANSYSSNISDGTIIYNGTDNSYLKNGFNNSDYFTFFSYNSTSHFYSEGVNSEWGLVTINVYKETNPTINITNYTVFIKNKEGSETFYQANCNNPLNIDVSDMPNGVDITIQISKDGYHTRTQVMDFYENYKYNITFYLAPDTEGGGDEGSSDYIPPSDEETELKTNTTSVSNPDNDATVVLECIPEKIVSVYGYNESFYGHWYEIPSDKYVVNGNTVVINSSMLDENTTLVKVSYYCTVAEEYASQYLFNVIGTQTEYGSDTPIDNAYVVIKRYFNSTGSYETIYRV